MIKSLLLTAGRTYDVLPDELLNEGAKVLEAYVYKGVNVAWTPLMIVIGVGLTVTVIAMVLRK